jgi:hypothetical protein
MGQPKKEWRERERERVGTTKHLVFCGDYNALTLF